MSKRQRFMLNFSVTAALFIIGFIFHAEILGVAK